MKAVDMEPDQWQMGKSKVFIKAPESVRNVKGCYIGKGALGDIYQKQVT